MDWMSWKVLLLDRSTLRAAASHLALAMAVIGMTLVVGALLGG